MPPAAVARFIVKYRYRMRRLAVRNQQIQRVLTGFYAGGTLNGMNTTN